MDNKKPNRRKKKTRETQQAETEGSDSFGLDSETLDRELADLLRDAGPMAEEIMAGLPPAQEETREQMNRRIAEQGHLMLETGLEYFRKKGDTEGLQRMEKFLQRNGYVKQPDGTWVLPQKPGV